MSLIIFLLILVALIVVHELGHFVAAKLAKVKVEEFGIGFPPRLFGIQRGETVYTINLLFFGGFVRIYGEKQGEGRGSARSFSSKSRWTQGIIVAAGIGMNLLLGWVLITGGLMVGLPTAVTPENKSEVLNQKVLIVGTLSDSPAAQAGIESGDILTRVRAGGASNAGDSEAMRKFIDAHETQTITLDVLRGEEEKSFSMKAQSGIVAGSKVLGIEFGDVGTLRLPFVKALSRGVSLSIEMTKETAQGLLQFLGGVVRGNADFSSVAGPIGIAQAGAGAVGAGWSAALILTALISINLALINVLPIPGLDGGRLLLIALEGIRRKPFSETAVMRLTALGFGALILLMLIVTYHDLVRIF